MQYPPENDYPIADATDHDILMHRDVHFGGSFPIMIDYYQREGKGAQPEFSLDRIRELELVEKNLNQNLAALMLGGSEAEQIAAAKNSYKRLKKVYEKETDRLSKLVADLILSEEEHPVSEINAIVAEGTAMVPTLLEIIKSDEYYDTLSPGYGFAPALAAKCLGLIGDKRSIIFLFESLGEKEFAYEDQVLDAFQHIGKPAKDFLLKVLHGRPITYDNEKAAMALVSFKEDPEVATACLNALAEIDLKKNPVLATYLILICEGLTDLPQRQKFREIAHSPKTPSILQPDFKIIEEHWKKSK